VVDAIASRGISVYASGEAIGSTTETAGTPAAKYLYDLWLASPPHRALLLSSSFNYIGIGVAVRPATGATFASLVFAEAPDSTIPIAQVTGASAVGRNVTFTWSGRDQPLQSHTAGLKDFDVQYRVDGGAWKTL